MQPEYIFNMFTFRSTIHNRILRADGKLIHIPNNRAEIAKRSFVVSSARLWNALPSHIRTSLSLFSFHYSLKAHLLRRAGLGDCVTGWFACWCCLWAALWVARCWLCLVIQTIYWESLAHISTNQLFYIFCICSTRHLSQSIA